MIGKHDSECEIRVRLGQVEFSDTVTPRHNQHSQGHLNRLGVLNATRRSTGNLSSTQARTNMSAVRGCLEVRAASRTLACRSNTCPSQKQLREYVVWLLY